MWWEVGRRSSVAYGPEEWRSLILVLAILPQTFPSDRALGVLLLVDLNPTFVGPTWRYRNELRERAREP